MVPVGRVAETILEPPERLDPLTLDAHSIRPDSRGRARITLGELHHLARARERVVEDVERVVRL